MSYDSTDDTMKHIERVRHYLGLVEQMLSYRGFVHDYSKLHNPEEKAILDRETPRLKDLEYGSEEYLKSARLVGFSHWKSNRHHPEFHAIHDGILNEEEVKNGTAISRMTLLDMTEMLVDWKAASERHATGDIYKSIEFNQKRFGYSDELKSLMINTAKEMGW